MARVCALVEAGSTPGRNPLLEPLREQLAAAGVTLAAWDPTQRFPLPAQAPPADLYLVKGDHPAVLTAAACLADAGARCLNDFEATAAAADKARTLARLARAGLPVPCTEVVGDLDTLAEVIAGGVRFVKPVRGAHGEGAQRLGPGDDPAAAGSGPWLVQEAVEGPDHDIKVYGVGTRAAVRRARFTPGSVDHPRERVDDPDPQIVELAVAAAQATGLTCWGVDFIAAPSGPVIIDVNAFPGYRSVADAPSWLTAAILDGLAAAHVRLIPRT